MRYTNLAIPLFSYLGIFMFVKLTSVIKRVRYADIIIIHLIIIIVLINPMIDCCVRAAVQGSP